MRRTFTLKVCGMGLLQGSPPAGVVGSAYAFQLTTVGGTGPYSFSYGPTLLPPSRCSRRA